MTILVTGAGGFIGGAVLKVLAARGIGPVVAMDASAPVTFFGADVHWVEGDLADPKARRDALRDDVSAILHLAAVPGGAAEADPALSRRVNLDATLDFMNEAAASERRPRFIYASTIAALGEPLSFSGVDDGTVLAPRMIYGAHKAMVETMLAALTRRGELRGLSLRLPGIVARPKNGAGLKSAFMSNIFHALLAKQDFVSPVSADAQMWMMSAECAAENLAHALSAFDASLPLSHAINLPTLRVRMGDLAAEIASLAQCSVDKVHYAPDSALETAFGRYPPISSTAADAAGFRHDGDLNALVRRAVAAIKLG